MRVFIYATLRDKHEREKALGRSVPDGEPTHLRGYQESLAKHDKSWWPTLRRVPGSIVAGELLDLGDEDIQRLDKWESRYERVKVTTQDGDAFTYIYSTGGAK